MRMMTWYDRFRSLIVVTVVVAALAVWFWRSDTRVLWQTEYRYTQFRHPEWSQRLFYDARLTPNQGSGDYNLVMVTDVRKIDRPYQEAMRHYVRERERNGLQECHVMPYWRAYQNFAHRWDTYQLSVPREPSLLFVVQIFPVQNYK